MGHLSHGYVSHNQRIYLDLMDENGHGTLWNSTRMMLMKQTSRRRGTIFAHHWSIWGTPKAWRSENGDVFFPTLWVDLGTELFGIEQHWSWGNLE